MEERQFVLSWKKIMANLKKYFWICLLTLLAGIGAFAYLHKQSIDKSKNFTGGVLFEADAQIYVKDKIDETQLNASVISSSSDVASLYIPYVMAASDVAALKDNTDVIEYVNSALAEKGYAKLNKKDMVLITMQGSSVVDIAVFSKAQPERAEYIADSYADAMVNIGTANFGNAECRVLSYSKAYTADFVKVTEYTRTFETADMIREKSSNHGYSLKELAMIAGGLAFGLFIIALLIIFDKKLYTPGDVQSIPEAIYLGEANNEAGIKLAAASTLRQCELRQAKKIAILGLSLSADELKDISYSKELSGLEKTYVSAADMNDEKISEIEEADVAIIYIKGGKDKYTVLDKLSWRVKTLGTDILGFVIEK